jgi:hypothetical protein
LWRLRVFSTWPDLFLSLASVQDLLKSALTNPYLPITLSDPTKPLAYENIRIQWRDLFYLLRRIFEATTALNKLIESSKKLPKAGFAPKKRVASLDSTSIQQLLHWYRHICITLIDGNSTDAALDFVLHLGVESFEDLVDPYLSLVSEIFVILSQSPRPDAEDTFDSIYLALQDISNVLLTQWQAPANDPLLASRMLAQCSRMVKTLNLNLLVGLLDFVNDLTTDWFKIEGNLVLAASVQSGLPGYSLYIHSCRLKLLELLDERGWDAMIEFQNAARDQDTAVPPPANGPVLLRLLPKLSVSTITVSMALKLPEHTFSVIESCLAQIQRAGSRLPDWQVQAALLTTIDVSGSPQQLF